MDLEAKTTQAAFGALVGISQPAVSELLTRGILQPGEPAGVWLKAYCTNLREQAAGRFAAGELDLATERAALARAQREKVEMQNAVTRRELAPVALLEQVLSKVGRQIAGILEAVPVQLKRRSQLSADDLDFITRELVKARNHAAAIKLADLDDEDDSEAAESDLEDGSEGD
ncbi:phage terminase Nu1 subunit (DNA packaging protein) [Herbaspirillum sp. 1173]|uniref:DNA packaging Nu1 n=2 Tax=Herbaspirillum TaxID=963 RepID=A0AAD0XH78_9BURK|nr:MULTISPECIES: terminase small subunit [Herbaspirillum]AYR24248.1 DNA packaging Nu1 [Herbaspirillum rubrisubalbicans]MDR6739595.1 phage terminase Nu1 subunit (DNA packaging protein) [Herbaspirillum sp. 1173]OWY32012.1 DNA packaging Nu1 [Herbaspirillum aquaticum]